MQTLVLLDLKESIRKLNDTALQAPTLPSPARKNGEQERVKRSIVSLPFPRHKSGDRGRGKLVFKQG